MGVSAQGKGVYAGGICLGRCVCLGVSAPGNVCPGGGVFPGGGCLPRGHTPPPVDRQRPVKNITLTVKTQLNFRLEKCLFLHKITTKTPRAHRQRDWSIHSVYSYLDEAFAVRTRDTVTIDAGDVIPFWWKSSVTLVTLTSLAAATAASSSSWSTEPTSSTSFSWPFQETVNSFEHSNEKSYKHLTFWSI